MGKKRLTIKQREFVREYTDPNGANGNGTRAALVAYDTEDEHTAHSIAYENLRKPAIRQAMETALMERNLTPNRIAYTLDQSLDANKVVIGTNTATRETVTIETPDHNIRLKGVELTAKLLNAFPGKEGENGVRRIRDLHLHGHRHIANEPDAVLEFLVEARRWPTPEERKELQGLTDIEDIRAVVATGKRPLKVSQE
jgi:phage terminase small subunit